MNYIKLFAFVSSFILFSNFGISQKEKEVKLKTSNGKLYGTLLQPEVKKSVPVVLIIAGSGPTDRNGNSGLIQTNMYKMMAEELLEKNIASLRFDKQGVGESAETKKEEDELIFEDLVSDVEAWISILQKNKDFSEVIIAGHSEGSLIGMLAAQNTKVDKFISIAGAGRPIDEILLEQISKQSGKYIPESKSIIKSLKKGERVDTVSTALQAIFRPSVQNYLISWMKYDPVKELAELEIPYMIIQGTTDIQVPIEDARLLNEAHEKDNLILIENLNHVLKSAPGDRAENMKTYYNPKLPLHKEVMDPITTFILNN
jgi:pimeloyl-ACP methyl ester carboxylesterase